MIDNLSLGVTHLLLMLAAIALLRRPDLDKEPSPHDRPPRPRPGRGRPRA
jgi:hypothetical protein